MKQLSFRNKGKWDVKGVGATGSGRQLAGVIVGADVVKNEITAHAVAAKRGYGCADCLGDRRSGF